MSDTRTLIAIGAAGVAAGVLLMWAIGPGDEPSTASGDRQPAEREPLYWVAPMDPNYRRDRPGKSPMGMDLVPVYEEEGADGALGVRIDPTLAHNFGVRLAEVRRLPLDDRITTLGSVALAEPLITHVHPRVAGWIERLGVDAEGDPVRVGEVLLELYAPDLVRAQEELLIALRTGDQALIAASRDRLRALGMQPGEIDALQRRNRVEERVVIRSDRDGFVMNLAVREGMYIEPRTEVMAVGGLDPVWVFAEVFERQAPRVSEGQPARLRIDYLPGREWVGEVDYVYPQLDPGSRTLRLRLRFDNPDRGLRPGMFGQVDLVPAAGEPVLAIPAQALIRGVGEAPDRVVVALGGSRFRSRAVEIGRVTSDWVEVRAGLAEGERVVASGQFLIDSESDIDAELDRMGAVAPAGMDHSSMEHPGGAAPAMDHSAMEHPGESAPAMDHSSMEHPGESAPAMDHSGMEHPGGSAPAMDHSEMEHPGEPAPAAERSP